MKHSEAPAVATWLLDRLTSGPARDAPAGDLIEQYRQGRSRALSVHATTCFVATLSILIGGLWSRPAVDAPAHLAQGVAGQGIRPVDPRRDPSRQPGVFCPWMTAANRPALWPSRRYEQNTSAWLAVHSSAPKIRSSRMPATRS